MKEKIYVLDASGIIGGFISSKNLNITTSSVISEIKDVKSKIDFESALMAGNVHIEEPDSDSIKQVQVAVEKSGDVLRLSEVDKQLVALAVSFQKNFQPIVVTDDYSMQNILKILNIPFKSVLTHGISELYGWIKICRGCRKKYPPDYDYGECEICGSAVYTKRIKK